MKVYENCFPNEYYKEDDFSSIDELKKLSEKSFLVFCYEFGIIPQFIERGMAQSILEELITLPLDSIHTEMVRQVSWQQFDPELEKGFIFTFSRFLRFLITINRVNLLKFTRNDTEIEMTYEESASLLLNLIESSPGFKAVQQKISVSNAGNGLCHTETYKDFARATLSKSSRKSSHHMIKPSLDDQAIFATQSSVASRYQRSDRHKDQSECQLSSLRDNMSSTKRLRSLSKNKKLASSLNYKDEVLPIFEKYSEPLNQIFSFYAGMGEPLNSNKMKSMKFNNLLKDAGILDRVNSISSQPRLISATRSSKNSQIKEAKLEQASLTQVDADIIFYQLTG